MSETTYGMECPWEQAVNENREKRRGFHDRRRQMRKDRLAKKIGLCGALATVLSAFALAGLFWYWIAVPAAVVLAGAACVYAGRLYEVQRK